MEAITIKTSSKQYPVLIGKRAIQKLPEFITSELKQVNKIVIITDEKVATLHLEAVKTVLETTGKEVLAHIVPEGEHAKTFDVFYDCQSFCLSHQLNRKSLIIALGGGAVGISSWFCCFNFYERYPIHSSSNNLISA